MVSVHYSDWLSGQRNDWLIGQTLIILGFSIYRLIYHNKNKLERKGILYIVTIIFIRYKYNL